MKAWRRSALWTTSITKTKWGKECIGIVGEGIFWDDVKAAEVKMEMKTRIQTRHWPKKKVSSGLQQGLENRLTQIQQQNKGEIQHVF